MVSFMNAWAESRVHVAGGTLEADASSWTSQARRHSCLNEIASTLMSRVVGDRDVFMHVD